MAINPTLSYLGFQVSKIIFDLGDLVPDSKKGEFKVNVKYSCEVHIDNKNDFRNLFVVTITHTKFQDFNFQIEAIGTFLINGDVTDIVYENFTNISAPSIVYPYIRAFISTVVLQAGLKPLFIPSLNFANKRSELASIGTEKQLE